MHEASFCVFFSWHLLTTCHRQHAEACHEWEMQEQRKRWEKEEEIRGERLKAYVSRIRQCLLSTLNLPLSGSSES